MRRPRYRNGVRRAADGAVRPRVRRWCATLAAVGALLPSLAVAQGVAKEGALFLLVPVGARAVGQGQAVVASRFGAEGIWWNPASLAWATQRELTVDHSQNFVLKGDAVDFVFPAGRAGVLSASVLYFNFGDQTAVDPFGTTIGTLYANAIVAGASYSATFGERFSAALTYKWLQQTQACGGSCPGIDTYAVSTSAFDFGVQAVRGKAGELTLGAVVKNIGFGLQTIDSKQTDPLPSRLHLGAEYRLDAVSRATPGAVLRLTGEVVTHVSFADPSVRGGAELAIADKYFVRGGVLTGSGDGANAAVGFGIRQGTLGLEFARTFGGLSSDAGNPPTYVSLRIAFR